MCYAIQVQPLRHVAATSLTIVFHRHSEDASQEGGFLTSLHCAASYLGVLRKTKPVQRSCVLRVSLNELQSTPPDVRRTSRRRRLVSERPKSAVLCPVSKSKGRKKRTDLQIIDDLDSQTFGPQERGRSENLFFGFRRYTSDILAAAVESQWSPFVKRFRNYRLRPSHSLAALEHESRY